MSERRRDLALLLLRLAGVYLAWGHGWGKLHGLATGGTGFIEAVERLGFPLPGVFAWAAALAEFGGGLLVALGLFTRPAAGLAAAVMAVAGFWRHRAVLQLFDALGIAPVPPETLRAWGNPELSFLFLLVLLSLLLTGPGRYSLDARLRRSGGR